VHDVCLRIPLQTLGVTLARNELVATLLFVAVAAIAYAIVHRPMRTPDVVGASQPPGD
jgi:hypothetical protein